MNHNLIKINDTAFRYTNQTKLNKFFFSIFFKQNYLVKIIYFINYDNKNILIQLGTVNFLFIANVLIKKKE